MDCDAVVSSKTMAIEAMVQVILDEVQSLRKEMAEEMKNLSEKLQRVLELGLNAKILKSKMLEKVSINQTKAEMPTAEQSISTNNISSTIDIRKEGKRLIATDDSCGPNEVIDITDFFDDLAVPQLSPSSLVSTSNSFLPIATSSQETSSPKPLSMKSTCSASTSDINEPSVSRSSDLPIAETDLMQQCYSDCSTDSEPSISKIANAVRDKVPKVDDRKDVPEIANDSDEHSQESSSDEKDNSGVNLASNTPVAPTKTKKQSIFDNDLPPLPIVASLCQIVVITDPDTGDKIYECPFCTKRAKQQRDMKRHMLVHTGERRHKCIFCNKAFKRASHMKCHMRTHTGEKPFPCDKCPKAFCGSKALERHKLTHEKPTSQKSSDVLDSSMKKIMEKPYVCSFCDKRFRHRAHRDAHARTHTGEKNYSCIICCKMFARKEHLERHMRSHTGEKPYKCPYCPKHYSDTSSVRKHQKIHSAEVRNMSRP